MSFVETLRRARAKAIQQRPHPWLVRLQGLKGSTGRDGVERITTQAVLDALEVPQIARTSAVCSTLARSAEASS